MIVLGQMTAEQKKKDRIEILIRDQWKGAQFGFSSKLWTKK